MNNEPINSVDFTRALADETRQKIMRLCCCQWLNVGEIVEKTNVTQPTVSHHLGILKQAGLVETRRSGKMIYYTLNQKVLASGCCNLAEIFAPLFPVVIKIEK
jgi:ArsR family transcriptional regulator, arsenate/arsenite/antimonite-responsive transcriptional repressor